MRRYRMRRNHSTASPGHLICFDTETFPKKHGSKRGAQLHTLRLGVASYVRLENQKETRRDKVRFTDADEFWAFVENKLHPRIPLWVFAHNIGFDLTVVRFWERFSNGWFALQNPVRENESNQEASERKGWGQGFMLLDDPPTVISGFDCCGRRLVFCDTLNFWRTSLATMGKSLGVPKMELPAFDRPDEEWFPYCERDVEVTEGCVLGLIRWIRENDFGRFRYTAPAQSLSAFRHRLMPIPIECHVEPDVRSLERETYYGGRLEAFFIGSVRAKRKGDNSQPGRRNSNRREAPTGPVYELDVTSLYPHVMRSNEYPLQLVDSSFERGTVKGWRKVLGGDCCALVYLETHEPFPCRRQNLGTIYPIGKFWTGLCGPELQRALDLDVIKACSGWSRYKLTDLFSEFVDTLFGMRAVFQEDGNTLYADLCKMMLNSLYGKFGQLGAEWMDRPSLEPPRDWGTWGIVGAQSGVSREFRIIAGHCQEKIERDEIQTAFPAIAAYVTSYGREYMRELRETAGTENVLYMVTDAVYVTQSGFDRLNAAGLIGKRELGKLAIKHQGKTAEFECFHHLRVGSYQKRGSVKSSAKRLAGNRWEEIRFQGLRSIISGRKTTERIVDPVTGDWMLKEKILPPLPGVLVYPVIKEFEKQYSRGNIQPNGWVEPLELFEGRT